MPERGDDTLTAFVRHLASERRLSPHTVKHYRRDLERAAPHLPPWTQVTVHDVRALVARLHRQGLGGRSLQRLLSTLRTFYTWMNREGLARDNPALDVRAPKSG
ncbi:MAG TPA: tyrosine recombinase XerC, partial [Alcanivorax sp.]|nr:tyrosine recombinase XerC [Alcanivorax sp.]